MRWRGLAWNIAEYLIVSALEANHIEFDNLNCFDFDNRRMATNFFVMHIYRCEVTIRPDVYSKPQTYPPAASGL